MVAGRVPPRVRPRLDPRLLLGSLTTLPLSIKINFVAANLVGQQPKVLFNFLSFLHRGALFFRSQRNGPFVDVLHPTFEPTRILWNNYEHYPPSAKAAEELILSPNGRNYWKARWDDCNLYFFNIKETISRPVSPEDAFYMVDANAAYQRAFGPE
jgi:hypothetical protein